MSVYEIVFSPTGGTKRVSEIFTKAFCQDSVCIDLARRDMDGSEYSFQEEDVCIVSVPSYGGRVPGAAVSRLRRMKGNQAGAILITVYGNRAYDDTFAELQDVLEGSGFSCMAAVAAVAEHSIMRQFAKGRPDLKDKEEILKFASEIRSKMEAGALTGELRLPGNRPYREYGGVPMKPQSGRSCIKCGLCAKECPVGAIPYDRPNKTDTDTCISCMRCISVCPQKARSVSKILLGAGSMKLKKACSERKKNELFV